MNEPTTIVPPPKPAKLAFDGTGMTHVGLIRSENEDAILTDPSGKLWAVADGMGGYGHGAAASDTVIERLSQLPEDTGTPDALADLIQMANHEIQIMSAQHGSTMGATVVAALMLGGTAHITWAGDSRAYLLRSATLRMLTRDHTVVEELVQQGILDPARAKSHHEAHVITRAVGAEAHVDLDRIEVPLVPKDRLMMCSDGVTGCLDDSALADCLRGAATPGHACRDIMNRVLAKGAPDNASLVVIDVKEG